MPKKNIITSSTKLNLLAFANHEMVCICFLFSVSRTRAIKSILKRYKGQNWFSRIFYSIRMSVASVNYRKAKLRTYRTYHYLHGNTYFFLRPHMQTKMRTEGREKKWNRMNLLMKEHKSNSFSSITIQIQRIHLFFFFWKNTW